MGFVSSGLRCILALLSVFLAEFSGIKSDVC